MVDDIAQQLIRRYYPIEYVLTQSELQDLLLEDLEEIFSRNGQQINNYNLPPRSTYHALDANNRLIQEEMNYDVQYLEEANKIYMQLNKGQKDAFHQIVESALNNKSKFC